MKITPRKVRLEGHGVLWFHEGPDHSGSLLELKDCGPDGRRNRGALSYAHVFGDGHIFRRAVRIGRRMNLIDAGDSDA